MPTVIDLLNALEGSVMEVWALFARFVDGRVISTVKQELPFLGFLKPCISVDSFKKYGLTNIFQLHRLPHGKQPLRGIFSTSVDSRAVGPS